MPPSLGAHDAAMSEVPGTREPNANSIVGKMDGVVKKAGGAISGNKRPESPSSLPDNADSPVAKRPDKHSMGYMVRSGIAGGIAGCAVCSPRSNAPLMLVEEQCD